MQGGLVERVPNGHLEAKPVGSLSLSLGGGGPCSDRAEEHLTPKGQEGGIQEVMEVD